MDADADVDADADTDANADAGGIAIALLHLSAGALKNTEYDARQRSYQTRPVCELNTDAPYGN